MRSTLIAALAAVALIAGAPASAALLGDITFPNSGAPEAQKDFIEGVLYLHNFEYEDAADAFQRAAAADRDFALAYWGEAMTHNHPIWQQQNLRAARAALQKLGPTPEARIAKAKTPIEKDYLRAMDILYGEGTKHERDVRYSDFMATLHEKYPDDVETTCFYALSLLGIPENGRDIPTYMRAAALLEEAFHAHPHHPGAAHYLIHSFDDPTHAILGLTAARAYSKIAPDAAHAQHMTSHIFLALGMWDETATANERAMAIVNRERAVDGRPPTSCGHYPSWLEYAYLQQGRFAKAKEILLACREQAEKQLAAGHAHGVLDPDDSAFASYAEMRAHYMVTTKQWSNWEIDWKGGPGSPYAQFIYDYMSVFADARNGDIAQARGSLADLEQTAQRVSAEYDKEKYPADYWERKIPGIQLQELRGLLLEGEGKAAEAVSALEAAAATERSLPFAFGPPMIATPSSELQGEVLLREKKPEEARKAFEESLSRAPRRVLSLDGLSQAMLAAGDADGAAKVEAELREIHKSADAAAKPGPATNTASAH
jgi:tetratricopeptide (TPR) repeat protein